MTYTNKSKVIDMSTDPDLKDCHIRVKENHLSDAGSGVYNPLLQNVIDLFESLRESRYGAVQLMNEWHCTLFFFLLSLAMAFVLTYDK